MEDLIDQCKYVADAASDTPFYYYNIPSLTGVEFPMINLLEMASKRIPNFAGLKNSATDIVDYQHCIHFAKDNYSLYWGADEAFMMLYAAGNRRYVGSTYNYMAGLYQKMLNANQAGDLQAVVSLQAEADAIYRVMLQYNGVSAGKEIMRLIGVDCGPVRRPLKPFTQSESETLLKKLKETSLFRNTLKENNTVKVM
jgi:N-acetylneuraminate lyase